MNYGVYVPCMWFMLLLVHGLCGCRVPLCREPSSVCLPDATLLAKLQHFHLGNLISGPDCMGSNLDSAASGPEPEVLTASLASIITHNYFICLFSKTKILPYTPILSVSLCTRSSFDSLPKTALFLPALPINFSLVFIDPMASPCWY